MTLAAEHAATTTTSPSPHGHGLVEVTATCACGTWAAASTTNPTAAAYDPAWLPTRLRTLHRDHVTDVLLDPAGFDTYLAAEWDAVLATLGAPDDTRAAAWAHREAAT